MTQSLLRRCLPLLAFLPLAGCIQDSSSYAFPEKDHAITLIRSQDWPWRDTLDIDVAVVRLPECDGGLSIRSVPLKAEISLFKAPDDYAEPIFILRVERRHFAVSTQSCKVQEFKETPPDPGVKLGAFREKDGKLAFVPEGA
jgi:hypothetical protein